MDNFTAENVMHLAMLASHKAVKRNINEALTKGLDKEKTEVLSLIELEHHKRLRRELHKLLENPRGFEVANGFEDKDVVLPERATFLSAGYDIRALNDMVIEPKTTVEIETGVKAFMPDDEVLMLYPRSSLGAKKRCNLANGVAVIDADYYGNKDNDGHILVYLYNFGNKPQKIEAGDRIAQGVFMKYETAGDIPKCFRKGGTGSTDI